MELNKLKTQLLNGKVEDNIFIFSYEDNTFLVNEYIHKIASIKNLPIKYTDSDYFYPGVLWVQFKDEMNEIPQMEDEVSVIFICNKVGESLIYYTTKFPKLQDWQIKDYASVKLTGLDKKEIEWLCKICPNIQRLDSEISKISLFSNSNQPIIFRELNDCNQFADLSCYGIFDFSNAILKRNVGKIQEILSEQHDFEPMALLGLLVKNFKNIIDIQLNSRSTPDSLGMSFKQFNAIKYNCGYYSEDQLREIYRRLTQIDYDLKVGKLYNVPLMDYIITKILSV